VVGLAPEVHGFLQHNNVSAQLFKHGRTQLARDRYPFGMASPMASPILARNLSEAAYLVIGVALHKKDIDHGELVDESVALELLSHAGADGRDGLRDRVHGLDLGRLVNKCVSAILSL
jgi:hypothetical protein